MLGSGKKPLPLRWQAMFVREKKATAHRQHYKPSRRLSEWEKEAKSFLLDNIETMARLKKLANAAMARL